MTRPLSFDVFFSLELARGSEENFLVGVYDHIASLSVPKFTLSLDTYVKQYKST